MNFYKFFAYWLPVFLWMGVIFYFSSIPDLTPGFEKYSTNVLISKLAHITEYAILAFLLSRLFRKSVRELFSDNLQMILQIVFFVALLYAVSDEYHQLFVQGREGTFRDIMIDSIGITLVPLYFTSKKQIRQKQRSQNKTTSS